MDILIILILVALLIGVMFLMCSVIAKIIVFGRRQTLEESWEWQMLNAPGTRHFKKEDFENYTVTGYGGVLLHASVLYAKKNKNRWIIMAHGYTDTRYGMLKYIQFFHKLDFHCVVYDERGHGENAPCPCSFGIREAKDLMAVIEDLHQRKGDRIRLGLLGESLGGATVLTALQYKPRVDFVVDDCGFADIIPILKAGLRRSRVPSFLVYPASRMAKHKYGESFTAARPVDHVRGNTIPLLIFHGADDNFIPCEHSQMVREATKGYAELHLIPEAGHAGSAIKAPDQYLEILRNFLKNPEGGDCGDI